MAALFLALPLARPFVKVFRGVAGLAVLPLPALGILAGIFPAYGFRSECIPLLVFALIFNIVNIPDLVSAVHSGRGGEDRDRSIVFTALSLAAFGAAVLIMAVFSPTIPGGVITGNVQARTIRNGNRDREFSLRIYEPEAGQNGVRPVIFLVPPESGSAAAVDYVCAGLRDRGFTVISFSRRDFDSPFVDENGKKHHAPPKQIRAAWRAFRSGTALKKANEQGKTLEAERRSDVEFLLPRIPALLGNGVRPGDVPVILAGYGAGGSAIAYLMGDAAFASRQSNVKGIVAIESRFWLAYQSAPPVLPRPPAGAGRLQRWRNGAANRFRSLKAQRVTGFGNLPRAGIPALYLVSSRAFTPAGLDSERSPYRALFAAVRGGSGPAAIAALEGAGPLDYCDYPLSHPVYPFMFPGVRGRSPAKPVTGTVNLITNFAVMLLEQKAGTGDGPERTGTGNSFVPAAIRQPPVIVPARQSIDGAVYIERNGLPDF